MTLVPLLTVPLAALLSAGLILLLKPLLQRYALARPNARSSHRVPTPQGGGIAIIAAALFTVAVLAVPAGVAFKGAELPVLALAVLALATVGAVDDIRPLPASLRLVIQAGAVAAAVLAAEGRILPDAPLWLERAFAILAGLWFVNLVNFMDGLDWMTLAEFVPPTAFLFALGLAGRYAPEPTLVAGALLGGLLGFAPFNRPVARLFMGDVGSLPVGLIVAWLLFRLAGEGGAGTGGLAAALILPLYPLADATLTLLWRLQRGEAVWQAHRSHYYQVATLNGFSVPEVVGAVFAVQVALAGLAGATLLWPSPPVTLACLVLAAGLVGWLLRRFAAPRADRAGGKDR
ncbi:glycosyl transferase [Methylorubrum rhodesianum]|uniref:glycosyl transferase n=1 Tax=Methylorubrum TaxID=2282523 RepID=UPI00161641B1|nr:MULTISPECIES: glycosyl transferase [Methylorubrum]MBB5765295.1 UDP-N-acetylmuramyl pentapeptide phosphotransferase/UDP-N-acetylglucosamine-1-phosphate transferase [Methylorubrum rhodesianum]MBI1691231.1 glycosyl transferase [Methylorubrum sp. DB1722]